MNESSAMGWISTILPIFSKELKQLDEVHTNQLFPENRLGEICLNSQSLVLGTGEHSLWLVLVVVTCAHNSGI